MRLTPADVHNVSFKKPSIGKRGYDEDEVDAFLDIVEAELAALIEENNELRQKVSSYEAGGAPPAAAADHVTDGDQGHVAQENAALREQLAAMQAQHAEFVQQAQQQQQAAAQQIQQAQQAAAQTVQQTEESQAAAQPTGSSEQNVQAIRLLDLAQETADRVTAEANAEATRLLAEATENSESTVADANAKAEAMVRDSQIKAEAIDRESERKYAEVMTQLTNQRTSLESKIDALRTYEREYRTRLKGWITEQLQQLETTGAAPAEGGSE